MNKIKSKAKANSISTSSSSITLFAKTHDSLTPIIPILTSFAHRNHNQHRSSHWWSAFNIFRRSLRNLDAALLKRNDASIRSHVSWISSHVIPRAYISFTQLAADNQHAPLGLMLLAVLANVATLVSDLVPVEATPEQNHNSSITTSLHKDIPPALNASELDRGVAISRQDVTSMESAAAPKPPVRKESKLTVEDMASKNDKPKKRKDKEKESTKDVKPKKKKKKAGDELSSLFGSLS